MPITRFGSQIVAGEKLDEQEVGFIRSGDARSTLTLDPKEPCHGTGSRPLCRPAQAGGGSSRAGRNHS
jgi:hypothetical protein